ncbi:reelin domain-containing protein 1-like [Heptranchias perlo]|uniref:reelin domain-containing protein 1-like n=1 Tax=Heptranchias perlo TaxID=212740 RepID=UPI003559A643
MRFPDQKAPIYYTWLIHCLSWREMPTKIVLKMLRSRVVLLVWMLGVLCLVSYTTGFSHGASTSACADMKPKHISAHPQNPHGSFITVYTNKSTYLPGDKIPVTVRSTRDFMGFLMQARRVADDRVAGTFILVSSGSKLLKCSEDGDTVTHSDKSLKRNLSFVWKAPDQLTGDIKFFVSAVQSYFVYWARIESGVISDQKQNHSMSIRNKELKETLQASVYNSTTARTAPFTEADYINPQAITQTTQEFSQTPLITTELYLRSQAANVEQYLSELPGYSQDYSTAIQESSLILNQNDGHLQPSLNSMNRDTLTGIQSMESSFLLKTIELGVTESKDILNSKSDFHLVFQPCVNCSDIAQKIIKKKCLKSQEKKKRFNNFMDDGLRALLDDVEIRCQRLLGNERSRAPCKISMVTWREVAETLTTASTVPRTVDQCRKKYNDLTRAGKQHPLRRQSRAMRDMLLTSSKAAGAWATSFAGPGSEDDSPVMQSADAPPQQAVARSSGAVSLPVMTGQDYSTFWLVDFTPGEETEWAPMDTQDTKNLARKTFLGSGLFPNLEDVNPTLTENQLATHRASANFLQLAKNSGSRADLGKVVRNTSLGVTRPVQKESGPGIGDSPAKGAELGIPQLGILLGCSAALGMALAVGLRHLLSQHCRKRTEVSFRDPDSSIISVGESGELVHVRKIRENSFVLVQAEYNVITPSTTAGK